MQTEQGQVKKFRRDSRICLNKSHLLDFLLILSHYFLQIVCAVSLPFISAYKLVHGLLLATLYHPIYGSSRLFGLIFLGLCSATLAMSSVVVGFCLWMCGNLNYGSVTVIKDRINVYFPCDSQMDLFLHCSYIFSLIHSHSLIYFVSSLFLHLFLWWMCGMYI